MVTVELSPIEAASFLKWREHQPVFETLLDSGILDIKNGSAEIHFNKLGQIASIDAHVKVFRIPSTRVIPTIIVGETPKRDVQ